MVDDEVADLWRDGFNSADIAEEVASQGRVINGRPIKEADVPHARAAAGGSAWGRRQASAAQIFRREVGLAALKYGYGRAISGDALLRARRALGRGELAEASRQLDQGDAFTLADRIAGEARSLIKDGRPGEAADRIDLYLQPGFAGRTAYAQSEMLL